MKIVSSADQAPTSALSRLSTSIARGEAQGSRVKYILLTRQEWVELKREMGPFSKYVSPEGDTCLFGIPFYVVPDEMAAQ